MKITLLIDTFSLLKSLLDDITVLLVHLRGLQAVIVT